VTNQTIAQDVIDLQERQWLPRFCAGDNEGFQQLVKAYQTPLYNYLIRHQVGEAHREDLLQDIFIRIHQGAAQYQPDKPLRPWIYTIAANTMRNFFRDSAKHQHVIYDELSSACDYPNQFEQLSDQEHQRWLASQLHRLPLTQKEALILLTTEGFSLKETAEIMDCPVNTVKTLAHRARQSLMQQFANTHSLPKSPASSNPAPSNKGEQYV
jgi:RNA polymerase sigma-70 factor (ECF subfamily)